MARYIKKTSFPITLAILLIAAIFTFRGEAQQPKSTAANVNSGGVKPISSAAVAFAVTDAVRDLRAEDMSASESSNNGEGEEKNPDNVGLGNFKRAQVATKPQTKPLPSFDAAIKGNVPSPNLPGGPLANFDGMAVNDGVTTIGGLVAPSDQNIAVGPRDVVQTTNVGFRVWDKAGNPRTPSLPIRSLFSKLGGVCGTFERGDPIVMHDRAADRWIISQFDFADSNKAPFFECIAVSKTSDPTGAYYAYAFQTQTETPPNPTPGPGQNFPDYPHIGTWIDGYYMTVNQFDRSKPAGSQFNGLGAYAFDRTKMLVGDPSATYVYFNLNLTSHPEGIASVQPADIDGFSLPSVGQPCPLAYEISDEYEIPPFNKDGLRMFNFHADFATPANSTFTERPESPVLLAPYDPRMPEFESGTRAEIQQPPPAVNGTDSFNAISYHLMYRLQYRRSGNNENLTSAFMVNISGVDPVSDVTYQAAFRYVQLRKTSAAGAYSVFDQATFAPDPVDAANGTDRCLPSAAIDNQGNLAVSYTTASTSIFPSIRYAGRDFNAAGIPTAGLSGEQTLFAGTGVQRGSANRWGDYQSLQVDPTDDCTYWTNNQYYNTTTATFNWRTRIGSFKFPTCTAPDQGTVSGTITSCETGAPISGAFIQFNDPLLTGNPKAYSTTSGPDGKYTIQLPSGPVQTQLNYSMTVSDPGRLCNQSATFTVPVGQNTQAVQDVCLSGTANPILDTTDASAVVISGGNGDGMIGPSECNVMNIKLNNPGCATAKNLTATLTSNTPGVTVVPPGTVGYPNIAIDGSSFNSVPFRVSTDASIFCGSISFTITTNFTGGSTMTTFTVPSACGTGPNVPISGSIDSTDPKTTMGRLGRANPPSTCAAPKGCPGALPGGAAARSYDAYSFVNGPGPSCVTFTPGTGAGSAVILAGAYLGAFDPTNVCTNYLADQGASLQTFSFNVPANATFNVVIMEASAGSPSTPYTFTISGISAPPPPGSGSCSAGLTTQVTPATATVGQSISDTATLTTAGAATGTITFKAYGPNDATCSTTPIFTSVVGVNGSGTYGSQGFTPIAPGTYNWIASYSGDANNPAATGACGDPNETTTVAALPSPSPTATATATATASATATATATPTATPASQALNLSTRMRTDTGDNAGIGGFTITGSVPKHVLIRALGPSLTQFGFTTAEVLADPTLEVHGPGAFGTITNNNWRDSQEAQIKSDGLPPTNDLESAIDANLPPGQYTAIVRGNTGTPQAGLCLFEVYDLDTVAASKLANLSTRA
ncbi:MAG TPA: hypothetical protein VH188_07980, partial [Chthoniobacterales bacterium]|nr:hypothetical protein [Chthoniobacterales bacterium]